MPTLTEGKRPLQFLMSEGNFHHSRDEVTLQASLGALAAGTVLGKVTATGFYKPSPDTGAGGDQVAVAVLAYNVPNSASTQRAVVIARAAEVKGPELAYDASVSDATKRAAKATQLAAVGVLVR